MKIVKNASFKILKNLYLQQKKSSPEIAKIFDCRPEYIRMLLRKYGIKIRSKSEAKRLFYNIIIGKKELRKLYIKDKISSIKIAKKFHCDSSLIRRRLKEYKIPIRSIREALPLSNLPKYKQYNFSGNSEEKAYLIGFSRGDLHVYSRSANSSSIFINVGSTKTDLIKIVEQSFSSHGHIWKSKLYKNGTIYIFCSLNRSFNFLLDKKDLIRPWILRNKKCFAAFLAGYIDAEGTFCLCGENAVFSIRSQDKNIIKKIRVKLIELGILLRPAQIVRKKGTKDIKGTISNKDIWALYIYRKDALLKLIDLVSPYLKHADKKKRTEILKENIYRRNKNYNRRSTNKYDKLYLNQSMRLCQDIPTLKL